jgi:hypothetical protein
MNFPRIAIAALAAVALAAPIARAQAAADAGPRPPCGGVGPVPSYAATGAAPNLRTWGKNAALWKPPACMPWPGAQYRLIVALAGSFRHDGDAGSLLDRFGAISKMQGMVYWSGSDKAWRPLITEASAVVGLDGRQRRADFTEPEMTVGTDLFFEEGDNRSSDTVVYRLRVLEAGPDRIAIETENVSPIQVLFMTLFPPASLRATYFLERRGPGTWSFYGLSSTSQKASAIATIAEGPYVNRAAALYRHFAGIPGDRSPPLAP